MKQSIFISFLIMAAMAFAADTDTFHQDHRSGYAKLSIVSQGKAPVNLRGENLALNYLENNHAQFGLPASLDNLKLQSVKQSLLGTHYTYEQVLMGHKVAGGNIVVSISNDNGAVYRVYNNTYPVSNMKQALNAAVALDGEDALDIAWNNVRVHGPLLTRPSAKLVWQPEGAGFRLVYETEVATEAPFGYWGHVIDAKSGRILDTKSLAVSRERVDVDFGDYEGQVWDRVETTTRFERAEAAAKASRKMLATANGTGQVFDPDPVTTLMDDTLEDNSAASNFTGAYFTRTLQDIDLSGSTYSLTGPWITVANFESPNVAPTTTTDGNWTGVRGQSEFNDAMTYFHTDQNQRYMQSLGFSGANGIQYGSIEADANGLNGADNSHYIPSSNRMAFGWGCVDDNEDAFVILHEYGHAIHFSINSNWSGGDTGGMGEGFGDYWGGAYRYSTPNGATFHPEWAFAWDGHNNCWGGRVLDNTSGQYDPSKSYGAHVTVNGVLSDELWSAPLFQTLVRLTTNHGVAQSEVDQIILEAHFGISSGPSMRDMATAIVATAEALQPGGPHAGVFREEFEARNILEAGPGGSQTDTFNSSVAGQATNSHNITVSDGTITLNLSWGNGNLDLELYNPSGSLVASANGRRDNPEVITYNTGGVSGTYRIDVVSNVKKKNTSYTLTANYNP